MAANPQLTRSPQGAIVPAPFPNEVILCNRANMKIELDGLEGRQGRWKSEGNLFVTSMRLVFISDRDDLQSGLQAFDLPLAYIRKESFNQPIFGCNHLAGECWPVSEQGGPGGSLPPITYRLYFVTGGIGTVLPVYNRFLKLAREAESNKKVAEELANQRLLEQQMNHAFVDPNDPTTIYLVQPVGEDSRLQDRPVYASNYGSDEAYEPLV